MEKWIHSPAGVTISYVTEGDGPPLVLVHGGFSNEHTNWEFVQPALREHFTTFAVARRGRGATDPTEGHSIEDEAHDVAALIRSIPEPVFLLGHSYGAQCSLAAAAMAPDRVRKLVLYEPPWPHTVAEAALQRLEELAARGDWDGFAFTFFREALRVPAAELIALRATGIWPPIVADARASLGDLRALRRYHFDTERFRWLDVPVLLQTGSESPRELYVTDALAAVLPDARIEELPGQAHEAMTTAPGMYTRSIVRFLLGPQAEALVA